MILEFKRDLILLLTVLELLKNVLRINIQFEINVKRGSNILFQSMEKNANENLYDL